MNSKLRAAFRGKAQTLSATVMVGKDGLSEGVVNALLDELKIHELVKVKFQDFKEETKQLSLDLEKATDSTLIATTGFTAVFYKANPDIRAYKELEVRYR